MNKAITITLNWAAKSDDEAWELNCILLQHYNAATSVVVTEDEIEIELGYLPEGMSVAGIKADLRREIRALRA